MSGLVIAIGIIVAIGAIAMVAKFFVERTNARRAARIAIAKRGAEMLYRAAKCLQGYFALRRLPKPNKDLPEILNIVEGVATLAIITVIMCFIF